MQGRTWKEEVPDFCRPTKKLSRAHAPRPFSSRSESRHSPSARAATAGGAAVTAAGATAVRSTDMDMPAPLSGAAAAPAADAAPSADISAGALAGARPLLQTGGRGGEGAPVSLQFSHELRATRMPRRTRVTLWVVSVSSARRA